MSPTSPPPLDTTLAAWTMLSRTQSQQLCFPLTPSPTSPYRAHRQSSTPSSSKSRPKPYHRPSSEFKTHGTATHSPLSPYPPNSSTSSNTQHHGSAKRISRSRSEVGVALSSSSAEAYYLPAAHEATQPPESGYLGLPNRTLQRSDSAPAFFPFASTSDPDPYVPFLTTQSPHSRPISWVLGDSPYLHSSHCNWGKAACLCLAVISFAFRFRTLFPSPP